MVKIAMSRSLSTFKIAYLLGVNPSSVANWIDQGLLTAHRTPGRHRRVSIKNLIQFLKEHKMPIPEELDSPPVRILVVQGERALSHKIAKALRAANPDYDITEAQDGFRAGQLVATLRPDMVILDMCMPGVDGVDICRQIKGQEETRHAAILAITDSSAPEKDRRTRECGTSAFLTKPVDMKALIEAVHAAF